MPVAASHSSLHAESELRMAASPAFSFNLFSFFRRWKNRRYRLQVLEARIALEKRIAELFYRLPADRQFDDAKILARVIRLRQHGMVSNRLIRAIGKYYKRASIIVHGGCCNAEQARVAVSGLYRILHELDDSHGRREPQPRKPLPAELLTVSSCELAIGGAA